MAIASRSVYSVITDRIVQQLEKGVIPWRRPWGGSENEPRNAISRKAYRGVNVFMLSAAGFDQSNWLTYRQAQALKGSVKKGEHGCPVVFWSITDREDTETGKVRKLFLLRYYTVFNVSQCEGLPEGLTISNGPRLDFQPIAECERIIAELPANSPEIKHGSSQAYYRPSADQVSMPSRESFLSVEDYYATLFHELTHSTGHKSRLDREGITQLDTFGSNRYSREELIAEMGAAFLCGRAGIDCQALHDNQAAYLASWIKALRGDAKLVVLAAAAAQKAADLLLSESMVPAEESTSESEVSV
jgi:antirestriction protein ArdC